MRQLQKRMKLRISAIDPKLADIQQPIYIAAPRFEGLEDPFFGSGRWALREGKQDALDVDTLMRNLPELGGMKAKKENAEKTHRVPVARSKSISIPGQPIPLAASAREIQALRDAQADTTISDYKNLSARFGYARVALEMAALAIHRGGLKDGERDTLGLTIAAAVVNSLDLGLSEDRVRREVRAVLQLTVSGTWIEAEWEGTADGSLVSRYLESSANFMAGKVDWDLRYLYSMKRLHQEWIPSIEEVDELGLKSLASDAQREMIRRRGEGLQEKPEDRMESRRLAPQVHDMKKNGTTLRAIAADLDISVSRVNRLLSLSAHEVDEVREWIASQDKSAIEKSEITKSIAFMEKRAVTKLELVAAIERESEQVISDEGWRKSVIRDGQIHSVITGVPPWLRRRAA